MAQKTNSFERFWRELKRRKVVHVITVYAAVAFVILQLVDMISQPLHFPEWTQGFIIVLLCIGFVLAVFVSWVFDITPSGVKKTKPVSEIKHFDHTIRTVSSGWKAATYISGFIIVALVAFNFIIRRNLSADISKFDKSIAVLPFINESPVDSNKHFINGIMEEVLTNLQQIKDFRVLSRTSTDQYKSPDRPTIPEIAMKLGVSYIVEGSGQKYGNKFRLRVQLIKAKGKENHLWAQSFEQELKGTTDLFNIQSQIAHAIATELKAVITPEEKQVYSNIPTTSLSAYDFYLRGREEQIKFSIDNTNLAFLKNAEFYYRQALKYDSCYSRAYSGLALVKRSNPLSFFNASQLDSILILADKALAYDNKIAEAHYAKATYFIMKGNLGFAEKEFDKALSFNPNYWEVYSDKAQYIFLWDNRKLDFVKALESYHKAAKINHGKERAVLLRNMSIAYGAYAGFNEIAAKYVLQALQLDGDSLLFLNRSADQEFNNENFSKVLEIFKEAYSIDTSNIDIAFNIGQQYMFLGQYSNAFRYMKKISEAYKKTGMFQNYNRFGFIFSQNGLNEEADTWFTKAKAVCEEAIRNKAYYAEPALYAYYDLAGINAFKGDKKKAYENLRIFQKIPVFPRWWLTLIKYDPLFNSIRSDDEFQTILLDLEAKYQAEHERVRKWLEEQGML